ncbi:hypothetical protein TNCV_1342581 [Trichonephila clavipes]|nr:hypothetical protein TNCV_1342581 [Trichonephila clavipes]
MCGAFLLNSCISSPIIDQSESILSAFAQVKISGASSQEDHLKPPLSDFLATTNSLHTTPQTVKLHQTPSPLTKTSVIWD